MNNALATVSKYTPPLPELALVSLVGFGLAQGSRAIPMFNNNPILTRTVLYTLGYVVARNMASKN